MSPTPTSTPAALEWSTDNCTIARAMEVLGARSAIVVLREVFNGVRRFEDMRRHSGLPRQVLTDRLALLVGQGILRRVPYQAPGSRTREEYRLTEKGLALYPVLVAVKAWGDAYLADADGIPLELRHRGCEAEVEVVLRCAGGHELGPRDVGTRPGPGAHRLASA